MAAYVIVQVEVVDQAKFEVYKAQVPATIERYGGRYLARGGAFEVLDGEWPVERTVLLEFPSLEAARRWYRSPEYGEAKAIRDQGARVTAVALEGV